MKYFKSDIDFNKDNLSVHFEYECVQTQAEYDKLIDYFVHRFSLKAGRPVPREEVNAKPEVGDIYKVRTFFKVTEDEELYVGLENVHKKAPHALALLLNEFNSYQAKDQLEDKLVNKTIKGLMKIIGEAD
tara:strand:- start:31428 stop:31817 length:390 start_codon:yes stop_codon:yes gene_type:complete